MTDPRHIASSIVGPVEWETEVSGFCRCPGEEFHTHPTKKKNCRVSVDGAPTIFCFHSSCSGAVALANKRLRRELGAGSWELALPGGRLLRSGDVLQGDGSVRTRAEIGRGNIEHPTSNTEHRMGDRLKAGLQAERLVLESLKVLTERFKPELFETFRWPFAEIVKGSPLQVSERDADDQFRTWLRLWPLESCVWIGDVFDSGKPEHKAHFRTIGEWAQIGPVMGNFTCGSSFKPGSVARSNANLCGHRFMVIESDTLTKDQVGAVFAYLNRRLHFTLHAIVDTAGKSLHGWFDAPRNPALAAELKITMTVLGCDPKLFTFSQPVRVPGAIRDGRLQRLVWLND